MENAFKADLLITNTMVYTQDSNRTVLSDVDIAIKDGVIVEIGSLANAWCAETVLDGTGKAVFPGMQNLHIHVFQSLLKGLGADLNLMDWVKVVSLKGGPSMNRKLYTLAAKVAAMEALRSGVTTLADFNYLQHDQDIPRACIETLEQIGIRGIYMDCYHDTGAEMGVFPGYIHAGDDCVKRTDALVKEYVNEQHPLTRVFIGASVPWGTTEGLYRAMVEYSNATQTPYTMHILETEEDNIASFRSFGKPLIPALEQLGVLTDRLLAVHCVCLKEKEMDAFVRYGVNAVYCPVSNAYIGSGIPPMTSLLHHGANITMGTDGAASNNSGDMVESLKIGLLLQKVAARSSAAMTAQNMLDFATINAAKACKRQELGSIEIGKLADLFILNPRFVRSSPNFNFLSTLMYSSSQENIETTIVHGKIAYHQGSFACGLEEAAVAEEADRTMKAFMNA